MIRLPLFCMTALALLAGCVQSPATRTASAPAQPQQPPQEQVPGQHCAPPAYPQEALQARMSGVSMMAFLVGSDGTVRESRLLKSSGYAILDHAAEAALRLCRFKPTLKNGHTVAAWQPVQYAWSLP
ncbi:energy transducer TonB [Massilia sp. Root1485]|uniref:energy transducer TonB n=1 Tax=Massilia sp. Root1485 TaxID=1736472 RepID=UPI0009EA7FD9|nr:energy transducer TonB [Massilia sp. Root1485]